LTKRRWTGMNKRKTIALGVALTMSASILLTGTFAWRSISQEAKNEIVRTINPGGRLHDDFNGSNKDVYVENFSDPADGGQPIFARIRLDEYMELGVDAGKNLDDPDRKATPLVSGADIKNVTTWRTHIPGDDPAAGDADDPFHEHWTWKLGGKTTYMPTFNKNKDSLSADINGTWANDFDDYRTYIAGTDTRTEDAYYDADDNDIDEYITDPDKATKAPGAGGKKKGDPGVTEPNYKAVEETHTAAETSTATVMTMKKWKEAGCPMGPIWVYDTDGWAYWAQAIAPGETTGLLLDAIEPKTDGPSYYGINVVAQFVTAGDWGTEEGNDGFYADNAGEPPTENALFLLKLAAGMDYTVEVAPKEPLPEGVTELTVAQGGALPLKITVKCGGTAVSEQKVELTLSGATETDTEIDESGELTVAAEEPVDTLITVTAQAWTGAKGSLTVKVVAPPDSEEGPAPGPVTPPEGEEDAGA